MTDEARWVRISRPPQPTIEGNSWWGQGGLGPWLERTRNAWDTDTWSNLITGMGEAIDNLKAERDAAIRTLQHIAAGTEQPAPYRIARDFLTTHHREPTSQQVVGPPAWTPPGCFHQPCTNPVEIIADISRGPAHRSVIDGERFATPRVIIGSCLDHRHPFAEVIEGLIVQGSAAMFRPATADNPALD